MSKGKYFFIKVRKEKASELHGRLPYLITICLVLEG